MKYLCESCDRVIEEEELCCIELREYKQDSVYLCEECAEKALAAFYEVVSNYECLYENAKAVNE